MALSSVALSRNRHYGVMCHIICRRSTGITGKSGYLSRGRGINGKSCAPCGNRYGGGSRSAHTQDEMDIYVNNGGICQYDTSPLHNRFHPRHFSPCLQKQHVSLGNAGSDSTAESDSPQSGMSDPHDPSGVSISSSSNDEYLCIKPTLAKFLVSLGYFSVHRLPLEGKKLS